MADRLRRYGWLDSPAGASCRPPSLGVGGRRVRTESLSGALRFADRSCSDRRHSWVDHGEHRRVTKDSGCTRRLRAVPEYFGRLTTWLVTTRSQAVSTK